MAISKTYLYSNDAAASCANIAAYLQENAVPKYFDSVTISDDEATVICTVGGVDLLKYTPSNTTATFVITTATGESKNVAVQSSSYAYVNYAYQCANGIAFSPTISTGDPFTIAITKNNNGETAVISAQQFGASTLINMVSQSLSAISLSCVAPLKTFSFNRTDYNLTTLVPFPCSNALGNPTYTPNAFYMPHSQNTAVGKLVINGAEYLSNGYWCIKD